jgi:hypothetical protein
LRRDSRVRRCDRANGVRCIRRGLRLRDRVHWALGREREWRLRGRCVLVRVRELRRDVRDRDMYREA